MEDTTILMLAAMSAGVYLLERRTKVKRGSDTETDSLVQKLLGRVERLETAHEDVLDYVSRLRKRYEARDRREPDDVAPVATPGGKAPPPAVLRRLGGDRARWDRLQALKANGDA